MYVLDTNAIIYYLTSDSAHTSLDRIIESADQLYVSVVSEVELFGFPSLTEDEAQAIERFLQGVTIIPLDSRLARVAGGFRREFRIKTPDSVIAATAFMTGAVLVTRNIKDFRKIDLLQLKRI